ncbi:hypothetical protein CTAYLR_003737 [Chrysophaeum taylorii]|uniref:START domain-containing protein n=1 Tax=Chrysophaeum taylorii TaxID=2483200 RepID=A0AAD7XR60_9STRA|nr:hypothetical protein CTAYLR_003737 [Chrysophaeum taylorii]
MASAAALVAMVAFVFVFASPAAVVRELAIFLSGAMIGVWYDRTTEADDGKAGNEEEVEERVVVVQKDDASVARSLARAIATIEASAVNPGEQGWTRWGVKNEVEVWFKIDRRTGVKHSLGVATVEAPLEATLKALEDETCKRHYDRQWKRTTVLRECAPDALEQALGVNGVSTFVVRRDEYVAIFPTQARDAVVAYARLETESVGVLALTSLDDGSCPVDPAYVRMHIHCGGYRCERIDATKTRVTSLVALDPKGSVPKSVVNFVAFDRPMALARLRRTTVVMQPSLWGRPSTPRNNNDDDVQAIEAALATLLLADADPRGAGWTREPSSDFDGIQVWFQKEKFALTRGVVRADVRTVYDAIDTGTTKLDRMREASKSLREPLATPEKFDSGRLVRARPSPRLWLGYKAVFPTSPRDALLAITDAVDPVSGTRVRWSTSIKPPSGGPFATPDPPRVRMNVVVTGFILRPQDNDHTHVTALSMVDPAGGLPPRLTLRLAKSRAKQIATVRTLVDELKARRRTAADDSSSQLVVVGPPTMATASSA